MKTKLKLSLIIFFALFSIKTKAQLPPIKDSNWQLNTLKSDEFSGSTLDPTKWYDISYPYVGSLGYGYSWAGNYYFWENRKWFSNDELIFDYQRFPGDTYEYRTGGIKSKNFDYLYGYFEISAKLPGYYQNGLPVGKGFWPTFWLYNERYNNCTLQHDEIDILEPAGCQYATANTNVVGIIDEVECNPSTAPCKCVEKTFAFTNSNLPTLFEDYHKYAVEWLHDRVIFYFDDQPFYSAYNHHAIPDTAMRVMIDLQVIPSAAGCWQDPLTMPQQMKVQYFRYYQYKKDCTTDITINNNNALNSFNFSVKRNITIGNGVNLIYLNTGDVKTFRATSEVTINGDFTVPVGSELNIIPTPCD